MYVLETLGLNAVLRDDQRTPNWTSSALLMGTKHTATGELLPLVGTSTSEGSRRDWDKLALRLGMASINYSPCESQH